MIALIRYVIDNMAKCIFLAVTATIVSALCLFSVNHYISLSRIFNTYEAYNLNNGIVCETYSFPLYADSESSLLNQIKNLDSVGEAYYLKGWGLAIDNSSEERIIDLVNIPSYVKKIPYKAISGRMINTDSVNEICLSSNFIDLYNVGDVINVYIFPEDGTEKWKSCELSIVGFYDMDYYLPLDTWSIRNEIECISGSPVAIAFTGNIITSDGYREVFPDFTEIISYPAEGFSNDEVKEDINSIVSDCDVFDYQSYKDYIIGLDKDNYDFINVTGVSSFILLTAVISAFTVIQLSIRKQDLLVYYICGCTWKKAIIINCFSNFPFLIVGTLLGNYLYSHFDFFSILTNGAYINTKTAIVITDISIISVYLIICLFFYFQTYKESAVESIRSE